MKRVILTGGTGFVGANLARRLLEEGHAVHLLLRENHDPWRIKAIQSDLHLHLVDLTDPERLETVVHQIRPEWAFHLAAYGAYSWQTDFPQMLQTNVLGTYHLVEACLKEDLEVFINTGSSSEYGYKSHPPQESEMLEPSSHYAITKASASLFCQYTARTREVHIPTVRLYSVYGPYEAPQRLLPTLIMKGLQNTLPPLVNPDIARDFIYIDDVCEAYLQIAQATDQRGDALYNVGSGEQLSLREVVEIARRVMAIEAQPEWGSMPDRHWDTTCWVADNQKMKTTLGWTPQTPFEKGFQQMVTWFCDHPELQSHYQ